MSKDCCKSWQRFARSTHGKATQCASALLAKRCRLCHIKCSNNVTFQNVKQRNERLLKCDMFQYRCFISFAQRSAASTFSRRRLQLPTCCWKSIFNRPDCGGFKTIVSLVSHVGFQFGQCGRVSSMATLKPRTDCRSNNFNTECGNVLQHFRLRLKSDRSGASLHWPDFFWVLQITLDSL
jgi:hypothetical protein